MLSQWAWKAKVLSIVEAMFTFWVFILISSAQAGAQWANAQIAWGQSAEWLGQGWGFHTQCHAPKKPPATKNEKQGGPLLVQDHGFQKWLLNICHWSFWEKRKEICKNWVCEWWLLHQTQTDVTKRAFWRVPLQMTLIKPYFIITMFNYIWNETAFIFYYRLVMY